MAKVGYCAKPQWVIDAIRIIEDREHAQRYRGRPNPPHIKRRMIIGAKQNELEEFEACLKFSLQGAIPEPEEDKIRRHVIDIDTKEFRNNGTAEDCFKISTSTENKEQTRKSFRLMAGKSTAIGGQAGLNVGANFFNVGNFGVNASGSLSRTYNKDKTNEDETTVCLTERYGIEAELKALKKTKLEVRITTYTVSYTAIVPVRAAIPSNASLKVMAPRTNFLGCTSNRFVVIGARDFIQLYTGATDQEIQRGTNCFYVDYQTDLQYLGEVTKIDKMTETKLEEDRT